MDIQYKADLSKHLTFHVPAESTHFVQVESDEELKEALKFSKEEKLKMLLLGGGSNILFINNYEGLVIKIASRGIEVLSDDGRKVEVVVEAGEIWHDFVLRALDEGWGGVENLALIPGCVGATPMQNIGAYGVEIKDVMIWLEAISTESGKLRRFSLEECALSYRESIFKREEKGKWVIVRVAYSLDRKSPLNTNYGAIEGELKNIPQQDRTHRDVANAVIKIRSSKLPDPKVIGNAGSFFKNPIVSSEDFEIIQAKTPGIPNYPQSDGRVKLAAGWLIDQAGWKGHDRGTHGVHDMQALVLVNKGGATGKEIWQLANDVKNSVEKRFGLKLETEVNQIT